MPPQLQKALALPRLSLFARQFQPVHPFLPIASIRQPSLRSPPTTNLFSTTTALKMTHDSTAFKDAVQHRRTVYQLTKKSPISDEKIKELLTLAIQDVPSSFNSQTTRIVALFHADHDKFWDLVASVLKPIVEGQNGDWSKSEARLKMFKDAYATILFYEDKATIEGLKKNIPIYADKFPQWSQHTSAMHQYMLWTALETEGLGCNLQHYNPIVDKQAAETWKVPADWELVAQLVVGQPAEGAREGLPKKEMKPVAERLHFHGA